MEKDRVAHLLGEDQNSIGKLGGKEKEFGHSNQLSFHLPAARTTLSYCIDLKEPILLKVSRILRNKGFPPSWIKVALNTLIGLNSASLGDPVVVLISEEEGANGVSLLDLCLKMTPHDNKIEISDIKQPPYSSESLQAPRAGIATLGTRSLSKILSNAAVAFERNLGVDHQLLQSGDKKHIEHLLVEGPFSWVIIMTDPKDHLLNNRWALRVQLSADLAFKRRQFLQMTRQASLHERRLWELEIKTVAALISNIKGWEVNIPFRDILLEPFLYSGNSDFLEKCNVLIRMLRNITRINQAPLLNKNELIRNFIRATPSEYYTNGEQNVRMVASKIDYYYCWLLLDNLINKADDFLSQRQKLIFEKIKNHTLNYIKQNVSPDIQQEGEHRILEVMSAHKIAWPSIWDIHKSFDPYLRQHTSHSTIDIELKMLMRGNFIKRERCESSKNKYLYCVNTLSLSSRIKLPHPSTVFSEYKIKVINPLTGRTEEI